MNNTTHDIVSKLWNLCNVLKDDGVTYHQYVTELTYLLFLKMAKETGSESQLPLGYRWDDLKKIASKEDGLELYKIALIHLGTHGSPLVNEIFANAISFIKKSSTFSTLITGIDKIEWYNARREDLGDIYEGILEKNANETKAGAGQYFTTRPLIDSIISVMRPSLNDIIQDPAAGTGGFLVSANRFILDNTDTQKWSSKQEQKYRQNTFYGMEHVQDTHRLALMNLLLHGIESSRNAAGIIYGDTLSEDGASLPSATLMLSNPPFGTKKGGGLPTRKDFPFPTSNKQFCFLQHIYLGLKPGGRAAVVVPDNVLFEGNVGKLIRQDLMDKCNLHTMLRLPTGIFYAQGVKTNVLFFTRGTKDYGNTKELWVYDLRSDSPQFGKRNQLSRNYFSDFEKAFGDDPNGSYKSSSLRVDTGKEGRFRPFTRQWIAENDESLDILWLKSESVDSKEHQDPLFLAQEAVNELTSAIEDLKEIMLELGEEIEI